MNINLSKPEIELLDTALEIWEREAGSSVMTGAMLGMMLCPEDKREAEKERVEREMKKATEEGKERKRRSIMIRAKLMQALSRESEFTVDNPEMLDSASA